MRISKLTFHGKEMIYPPMLIDFKYQQKKKKIVHVTQLITFKVISITERLHIAQKVSLLIGDGGINVHFLSKK